MWYHYQLRVADMNKTNKKKKNGEAYNVHPNSLANLQRGNEHGWQPGQSGNPAGRPKDPIRLAREHLSKLFFDEYWQDNEKREETIVLMLKGAIQSYMEATGNEKQRWYELIVGNSSTAVTKSGEQPPMNPINAQNVIILPPLVPVQLPKPPKADEPEFEVIK